MTNRKKYAALLDAEGGFDREGGVAVTFTYDFDDPSLTQLREKYNLAAVAGEGDAQERAIRLLHWLCARSRHSNDFSVDKQDALCLLEYVSDTAHGLNCKYLSVILSEMCLSVGIKARILWLMPRDPEDPDCHAVVMAHTPERGKWIFLDPTSDVYFADAEGNALSPMEIRDALARGGELIISPEAVGKNKSLLKWYLDYLAKDMFRFESIRDSRFGTLDHECVHIHLCPARFDLAAWQAAWQAKKFHGQSRQREYIFASPESFWAAD